MYNQQNISSFSRQHVKRTLAILVIFLLFLSTTCFPLVMNPTRSTQVEGNENFQIESSTFSSVVNSEFTSDALHNMMSDNNSTTTVLLAPPDVALKNYNAAEFAVLLGNVTYNVTNAQNEIVLVNANNLITIITISIRAFVVVFDIFLIACVFLLRNYEPIKSKFTLSLVLILLNIISHIQGTITYLPMIKMYFENYWNQFLLEKSTKAISAATFYQNNLNANGLPTWLVNYITFENVYCFINSYIIYGLIIISIALYSVQIIKLMLLTVLKDKKQSIVKSLEDFKEKQLEKFRNIKLQTQQENANNNNTNNTNNNNRKSLRKPSESTDQLGDRTSNLPTDGGVSFSLDLSSLSQSVNNNETNTQQLSARNSRPSDMDEISTTYSVADYDDIALDLTTDDDAISTSYDEISKQGRFANLLKRIIKYRVVEISYISFWTIVWFIIVSVRVASHTTDYWEYLFYSWDKNSGYCRRADRDNLAVSALIILFILFLSIPLFLAVDFILAIYKYIKIRKVNKEKGEKTENFFIYYFYESDPFVYRIESISIVIIDITSGILIVIFPSQGDITSQLVSSIVLAVGLNFLGGSISNPGITVSKGIWNFFLAFKEKRKAANSNKSFSSENDNSNSIQSIDQLLKTPICSFSIDFVLSHKKERDLFYEYLREEYSVENLLFVEDLNRLRKINERHVRSKVMKIKEMTKLYLSESNSVFEVNVPYKIIQNELKDYKELITILNDHKIKINQLPRVMKDISTRYFPNIEQSKEEIMKPLISNICKSTIFSMLQTEVYKNLMDSFYRFNNSRKWKDHIKNVQSP